VAQFRKQLDMVARLAAKHAVDSIFVCSFNEHFEDTAVEPTVERGRERLQAIRATFGLQLDYRDIHQLGCDGPMVAIDDYEISRYECPDKAGRLPYVYINWYQAAAVCANSGDGYRLCRETEWEDACDGKVGSGGLTYPYGNTYQPGTCNDDLTYGELRPSGSLPGCVSSFGVYDLSGNAGEFVEDQYPGDPVRKMSKGGTYQEPPSKTTCQARWKNTPDYIFPDFGFRCCRDAGGSSSSSEDR
jgi:hypothetical protein